MKRFLAIILCIIMVVGLVSCGQTGTSGSSTPTESSTPNASVPDSSTGDSSGTTDSPSTESSGGSGSGVDSSTASNSGTNSSLTDNSSEASSGQGSSVDSSSGASSSPTTSSSTKPRPDPIITPDRTNYQPTVVGDKEAIYYINEVIRHPILTPYYGGKKTALTMTFDDGYDSNTGVIVSDEFEKYGFRGTMMLGPCFLGSDQIINEWNSIFARGFLDVGCHGYNHAEPTTLDPSQYEHEIKDAIMFLRDKFPGQRVLTFATPYAHINQSYEDYLSQFSIGNRLEAGGSYVNFGEDLSYNPYRVKAVSFNAGTGATPAKNAVEAGVEKGRWVVELFHCVKDNASGVDVMRTTFISHCEWLYRNYRDDLWVASFEEVLIYGEQLKHTSVDYTACDKESMTVTVTPDGTLDKEIYNIPMTVRVFLPSFVDSAYAMIDGEYIPLDMQAILTTGEKYVDVLHIDATKKTDIVVYIGGNKTMKNNCVHRYSVAEVLEPTHDEGGYTLNECTKCKHTYKSAITNPVHDYTGKEVVVIAPTESKNGLSKHFCTDCDKYIVKDNIFVGP